MPAMNMRSLRGTLGVFLSGDEGVGTRVDGGLREIVRRKSMNNSTSRNTMADRSQLRRRRLGGRKGDSSMRMKSRIHISVL